MIQTFPNKQKNKNKIKYKCNKKISRMESDERLAIENDEKHQQKLLDLRKGAEIHRQVRQAAQNYIKPGKTMVDICNFIESSTLKLSGYDANDPFAAGYGFPTGCSLNHCAAHYTPNSGDKTVLKKKDLCKIDFGVQINGSIIDSAFSMSFDPMHDQLMVCFFFCFFSFRFHFFVFVAFFETVFCIAFSFAVSNTTQ